MPVARSTAVGTSRRFAIALRFVPAGPHLFRVQRSERLAKVIGLSIARKLKTGEHEANGKLVLVT
jgi:hypothetical protein